jgi:hypothetical protein
MQPRWMSASVCVFALLAAFSGPADAAAADSPLRAKFVTERIVLQPNGLATRTYHWEFQPTNAGAVQRAGQMPIRYTESMEDLDILGAYTAKADGRHVAVDIATIQSQLVPGTPQMPLFTDQKQKVILFRDVEAGDTLVADFVKRQKQSAFPGHFSDLFVLGNGGAIDDMRVTYLVPASLPVYVDAREVKFEKTAMGDQVQYEWRHSVTMPRQDILGLSPIDRLPRFLISTFKDYDTFAASYARIVGPKMAVTPKIQALADQLTAGTTDRRQQAQLLYEYVGKRIRYVALAFGAGGVVPRDAERTLSDLYGDCKDQAVLYGALLRAKGMTSDLVILGEIYTAPAVPGVAPFNHVISWLPEFNMYADTTAVVAPFGTLPIEEYGKPVIHAVASGKALRQIPILASGTTSLSLKTNYKLSDAGRMSGTTAAVATGPFGVRLRQQARTIQATGVDRFVTASTMGDATGTVEMTAPEELAPDYKLLVRFEYDAPREMLRGDSFALGTRLWFVSRPGGVLLGSIQARNLPDSEPTPCLSGFEEEDVVLEFPADRRATVPQNTEIKTPHLRYVSNWTVKDNTVTVHREFETHVDQPLCTGDLRKEVAAALDKIRDEYGARVTLSPK